MNYWTEVQQQSGSRDRRADSTSQRTFVLSLDVPGSVTPAAVVANPTGYQNASAQPLPAYGSPHPLGGGMILDRYDVEYASPGASVLNIRALYSNNGSWTYEPAKPQEIGEPARWQNSYGIGVYNWPYALSVPEEGLSIAPIRTWRIESKAFRISTETISAQVVLVSWDSEARQAVRAQINKIHFFDGKWWRFTGATADVESNTRARIQYNWIGDPGNTQNPWAGADPARIWFTYTSQPFPPDPTVYVRRPFYDFVPEWDSDDVTDPPNFHDVPTHDGAVPNGHLTLEGM